MVFTFQETGQWLAFLTAILSTLFDQKKSVRERGPHNRRESAGEATDGAIAWGAWLEETLDSSMRRPSSWVGRVMVWQVTMPKLHQVEHEEEQEQEQIQGHRDPRCLKLGAWKASTA